MKVTKVARNIVLLSSILLTSCIAPNLPLFKSFDNGEVYQDKQYKEFKLKNKSIASLGLTPFGTAIRRF